MLFISLGFVCSLLIFFFILSIICMYLFILMYWNIELVVVNNVNNVIKLKIEDIVIIIGKLSLFWLYFFC